MAKNIHYLNDDNFEITISEGITLVDFYADWCGPCKRIAPVIEELAGELGDKAKIAKLDIESAQKTTAQFEVMSIPTIILFKDGEEIKRVVGVIDKDGLKKMIESVI